MLLPVPTGVPPQLPENHSQTAPGLRLPPVTESVAEPPGQIAVPPETEVGAIEAATTVTVNEQVPVWPLLLTENVFVVVPKGKTEPLGKPAVCVVTEPEQLSVPTGAVYVTVAPQVPAAVFTEILLGQVIAGAILSMSTWITFE